VRQFFEKLKRGDADEIIQMVHQCGIDVASI
jgi:hypothetical protein